MFKRILVPLDGSALAESILPASLYLAERFGAVLVFFHVIEQGGSANIHGERHLADMNEARAYLDMITTRLACPPIICENHVHETKQPDVPQSIIAHAEELHTDLIMLCAHGRGGLRDVFIGSIAQQVIQRGTTPVFFIRQAQGQACRPFSLQKILVPLDGTDKHVSTLPIAMEIARICNATLRLVTVVPTTSTLSADEAGAGLLLPSTMAAVLDLAQRGAKDYLVKSIKGVIAQGVSASGAVMRGDVPSEILKTAEDIDLIIMSTHARVNWDAFWEESVTPKVMTHASVPMLLVRSR
jgi:nucleotide-binding universal stress UspA family protein